MCVRNHKCGLLFFALLFTARFSDLVLGSGNLGIYFFGDGDGIHYSGLELSKTSFSFELWVNVSSFPAIKKSSWVLVHGGPGCGTNECVYFGFTHGSFAVFGLGGDKDELRAPLTDDLNVYVHWAGTFDIATRRRNLYRNGELVGTDTAHSAYQPRSGDLFLGRDARGSNRFHGAVDEIRFWRDILTPAVIKDWMMWQDIRMHPYNKVLAAHLQFDDGPGATTRDSVRPKAAINFLRMDILAAWVYGFSGPPVDTPTDSATGDGDAAEQAAQQQRDQQAAPVVGGKWGRRSANAGKKSVLGGHAPHGREDDDANVDVASVRIDLRSGGGRAKRFGEHSDDDDGHVHGSVLIDLRSKPKRDSHDGPDHDQSGSQSRGGGLGRDDKKFEDRIDESKGGVKAEKKSGPRHARVIAPRGVKLPRLGGASAGRAPGRGQSSGSEIDAAAGASASGVSVPPTPTEGSTKGVEQVAEKTKMPAKPLVSLTLMDDIRRAADQSQFDDLIDPSLKNSRKKTAARDSDDEPEKSGDQEARKADRESLRREREAMRREVELEAGKGPAADRGNAKGGDLGVNSPSDVRPRPGAADGSRSAASKPLALAKDEISTDKTNRAGKSARAGEGAALDKGTPASAGTGTGVGSGERGKAGKSGSTSGARQPDTPGAPSADSRFGWASQPVGRSAEPVVVKQFSADEQLRSNLWLAGAGSKVSSALGRSAKEIKVELVASGLEFKQRVKPQVPVIEHVQSSSSHKDAPVEGTQEPAQGSASPWQAPVAGAGHSSSQAQVPAKSGARKMRAALGYAVLFIGFGLLLRTLYMLYTRLTEKAA